MDEIKREKSDSNQITQADLDSIRALAKEATPGPWFSDTLSPQQGSEVVVHADHGQVAVVKGTYLMEDKALDMCKMDGAYISAMHPGMAIALVDEIERLTKLVALWRHDYETLSERCARLEEEADWLAGTIRECRKFPDPCGPLWEEGDCILCWREAARKAVEEKKS